MTLLSFLNDNLKGKTVTGKTAKGKSVSGTIVSFDNFVEDGGSVFLIFELSEHEKYVQLEFDSIRLS